MLVTLDAYLLGLSDLDFKAIARDLFTRYNCPRETDERLSAVGEALGKLMDKDKELPRMHNVSDWLVTLTEEANRSLWRRKPDWWKKHTVPEEISTPEGILSIYDATPYPELDPETKIIASEDASELRREIKTRLQSILQTALAIAEELSSGNKPMIKSAHLATFKKILSVKIAIPAKSWLEAIEDVDPTFSAKICSRYYKLVEKQLYIQLQTKD